MDKRHLHHIWRLVRPIKPRYFLALAVIFGAISIFSLRANNLHMIQLRNDVYQADKNNGDTGSALNNLREYVYAHMNTDLSSGGNTIYPPIQLKYSYNRAIASQTQANPNQNTQIYTDAQTICQKEFPMGLSGRYRIPCIQQYIASHGITQQATIPVSLYEFDFVSPRWSPDLAGWSMLAGAGFGILTIISFVSDRWLKIELRD